MLFERPPACPACWFRTSRPRWRLRLGERLPVAEFARVVSRQSGGTQESFGRLTRFGRPISERARRRKGGNAQTESLGRLRRLDRRGESTQKLRSMRCEVEAITKANVIRAGRRFPTPRWAMISVADQVLVGGDQGAHRLHQGDVEQLSSPHQRQANAPMRSRIDPDRVLVGWWPGWPSCAGPKVDGSTRVRHVRSLSTPSYLFSAMSRVGSACA